MAWSLATSSSESRLSRCWAGLRQDGRTALIPYLTAGYPDALVSRDALRVAAERADILEVGVPFSDPLADGPTIQESSFQALRGGMTLPRTLELIADAGLEVPVVLFSYLNPVLQYGVERLVADAAELGVAGLLLTDLPAGADAAVEGAVRSSPLDLIRLVAPTSGPDRIASAVQGAEGFIYLVARLGVTGASATLDEGLAESVAAVRAATPLPIAVGFGISSGSQAAAVAGLADGVVVGSALVTALGQDGVTGLAALLDELRQGIDGG
jgi:tryptophan synthase alpha chain